MQNQTNGDKTHNLKKQNQIKAKIMCLISHTKVDFKSTFTDF